MNEGPLPTSRRLRPVDVVALATTLSLVLIVVFIQWKLIPTYAAMLATDGVSMPLPVSLAGRLLAGMPLYGPLFLLAWALYRRVRHVQTPVTLGGVVAAVNVFAVVVLIGQTTGFVAFAIHGPTIVQHGRVVGTTPSYQVGDTLAWLPTKGTHVTVRRTVLLFGRSTCPACQESISLNKRIHDAVVQNDEPLGSREHTTRMILYDLAGNGKEEVEFAAKFGLGRLWVGDYRKPDPKLHSVPTYLVLDENSTVLFVTEGMTPVKAEVIEGLLARP